MVATVGHGSNNCMYYPRHQNFAHLPSFTVHIKTTRKKYGQLTLYTSMGAQCVFDLSGSLCFLCKKESFSPRRWPAVAPPGWKLRNKAKRSKQDRTNKHLIQIGPPWPRSSALEQMSFFAEPSSSCWSALPVGPFLKITRYLRMIGKLFLKLTCHSQWFESCSLK